MTQRFYKVPLVEFEMEPGSLARMPLLTDGVSNWRVIEETEVEVIVEADTNDEQHAAMVEQFVTVG